VHGGWSKGVSNIMAQVCFRQWREVPGGCAGLLSGGVKGVACRHVEGGSCCCARTACLWLAWLFHCLHASVRARPSFSHICQQRLRAAATAPILRLESDCKSLCLAAWLQSLLKHGMALLLLLLWLLLPAG
jgi:hypothetical protein